MAAGDIDDEVCPPGTLEKLRAGCKELDEYLEVAWTFRPYHSFFIPYGAGISEDGRTVYISNDLLTYIQGVECENAIVRHETTEWALRYYLNIGEDYAEDPEGHRIANRAEFERAEQLIDKENGLEIYQEIIDQQIMLEERISIKDKPIPRDLAMYPYEGDIALYDRLQEEMWNERSNEEWQRINPEPPADRGAGSDTPQDKVQDK